MFHSIVYAAKYRIVHVLYDVHVHVHVHAQLCYSRTYSVHICYSLVEILHRDNVFSLLWNRHSQCYCSGDYSNNERLQVLQHELLPHAARIRRQNSFQITEQPDKPV